MSSLDIGDVLFSKTRQRVLGLLYGKPDQRFFANEIVRHANMGRGTVRRELERLADAGLLHMTREGNQHYYQANRESPIYSELLQITRKTFGLVDLIHTALTTIDEQIQLAFVYGSMAKSTEIKSSDIDLMLIGDRLDYSEVMALLLPLEQELGRQVNPTIYTLVQFREKLQEGQSFLTRLMEQPKLMIKGVIDDFGKPV